MLQFSDSKCVITVASPESAMGWIIKNTSFDGYNECIKRNRGDRYILRSHDRGGPCETRVIVKQSAF